MHTVTCLACGWVMVAYSRAQAEQEVAQFNAYFAALTENQRIDYYGHKKADIKRYEQCFGCGGAYQNFRHAVKEDCPDGVTLLPLIQDDV
jgi:hypothetical protein